MTVVPSLQCLPLKSCKETFDSEHCKEKGKERNLVRGFSNREIVDLSGRAYKTCLARDE